MRRVGTVLIVLALIVLVCGLSVWLTWQETPVEITFDPGREYPLNLTPTVLPDRYLAMVCRQVDAPLLDVQIATTGVSWPAFWYSHCWRMPR